MKKIFTLLCLCIKLHCFCQIEKPIALSTEEIHDAAKKGDIAKVSVLLERDPLLVDQVNLYGYTPLHLASMHGHLNIVELLLSKGAHPNTRTKTGCTALYYAQDGDYREIEELLISKDADKESRQWPVITGDYIGEVQSETMPKIFAPGIISSMYSEHSPLVLAPDKKELFWSVVFDDPSKGAILSIKKMNNEWHEPKLLPFSKPQFRDVSPFLSEDGKQLYFQSCRSVSPDSNAPQYNIWFVRRNADGWDQPKIIDTRISSGMDGRPLVIRNGTLYFCSWRDGINRIYRSVRSSEGYVKVEKLETSFNQDVIPSWVSNDQTTIIFETFRSGGIGGSDLWISFKIKDGTWGDAINLGDKINSTANEWFASFSPDKKYFFFVSDRNGNNDVYWIATRHIIQFNKIKK